MKILKPSEVASQLNVTVNTLQRWDREGIFEAQRTPTNRRYYTQGQVDNYLKKEVVFVMDLSFYEELFDQIGFLKDNEVIELAQFCDGEEVSCWGIKCIDALGHKAVLIGCYEDASLMNVYIISNAEETENTLTLNALYEFLESNLDSGCEWRIVDNLSPEAEGAEE